MSYIPIAIILTIFVMYTYKFIFAIGVFLYVLFILFLGSLLNKMDNDDE